MTKHEWIVISSGSLNEETDIDTAVMEVPNGVVMRYRMHYNYAGRSAVSLVFIPAVKITDFTPETEEEEET